MNTQTIKTIDVHDLKSRMDNNPELCLIDVREITEWNEQHIPGAIHIPKDDITNGIKAIATDTDQVIYLHCRSGMRSLYAAECLMNLGYKEVYSVNGGIMEWVKSGYPIE